MTNFHSLFEFLGVERSLERPCSLLLLHSSLVAKSIFVAQGIFLPLHLLALSYLILFITIIIISLCHSRILASGVCPLSLFLKVRDWHQDLISEAFWCSSLALGSRTGSTGRTTCINCLLVSSAIWDLLVLPFGTECLRETRVRGYNKMHGYICTHKKISIHDCLPGLIAGYLWVSLILYFLFGDL